MEIERLFVSNAQGFIVGKSSDASGELTRSRLAEDIQHKIFDTAIGV